MNSRSRTVATFFSVAMATSLLAAFFQSQVRRPETAHAVAAPVEMAPPTVIPQGGTPLTLDTFRNIVKAKNAAVVNITVSQKAKPVARGNSRTIPFPFFGDQGGGDDPFGGEADPQGGAGSGFIINADGTILTNRHVIEGADSIRVRLVSGKTYDGRVIGKDSRTDVALVKIDPKETLTVLELGNSDALEAGEWVMAIGAPFGFSNSLSVGVVSGKGRDLTLGQARTSVEMIQTDAAINPGNSGGPLLNTSGQVVGINTLIVTRGAPQSSGVGFSVPINVAKGILPQLKEKGKVVRGWLGVEINTVTEDLALTYKRDKAEGSVIQRVTPGSPAEKAGLETEDLVIEADGRVVKTNNDLTSYIASLPPGTTVTLKVIRGTSERTIKVTLGTFPEEDAAEGANSASATPEDDDVTDSLGMSIQTLNADVRRRLGIEDNIRGVMVRSIEAGGAAELAGLSRGDIIVLVGGKEVGSVKEFNAAIKAAAPAKVVRVRIQRGDQLSTLALRLDR